MKEMIKTENSSNIMIGVGILGLLAYGYMLMFSDISIEYLKYSVLACAFASLLPFALTIRKMTGDYSTGAFWGIVIGVAVLVFLVAYSMMKPTDEGVLFDLFAVVSSDNFRWLYLVLIIIATICPFVWEKGAPWITAIAIGVLVPVILSTILVLLAIVLGCYVLSLFGKSKGTSSSGFGNWLSDLSNNNQQDSKPEQPKRSTVVDNRRYAWLDIEYCRRSDYEISGGRISNPYKAHECLPVDFTFDQIAEYLRKKYGKVDMVILNTKIDLYAGKDSVDSCAWKV